MKALVLLIAVLAAALPAQAAPGPSLTLRSQAMAWMSQPRSNMAVVQWNDRVYCLGGNGPEGASAAAWEFNPYTRSFKELAPMPSARFAHGAAICGQRILVFGGMRDGTVLDTIDAFDLETRSWSSFGRMPFSRARFGLAVLDGKVFLAGGSDSGGHTAEVHAYDPKANRWERCADLPNARDRLALVGLGGMLYAIGGETRDGKGASNCWRYSPADDRWTTIASLGQARKNLTAVRLGNAIVAAGGWNIVDDEKVFLSRVEVYDPADRDWNAYDGLESPRDGCRAVTWRGRVFIFGGYNGDVLSSVEQAEWRSRRSGWIADPALKLHLATYAEHELPPGAEVEEARPLNLTTPAGADIANIGLGAIRSLGFPLPSRDDAASFTFFLKFYEFPGVLSQEASVRSATAPFLLSGTAGFDGVATMIAASGGVVVKKGLIDRSTVTFDARHPFPVLRVSTAALDGLSPQEHFDRAVVFSSLYVRPAGEHPAEDARASVGGVRAFVPEALALLSRSYRPIEGPDPGYAYFLDDSEADQAGSAPGYSVIRIARAPIVFENWRDLPMPQDPAHMFLTALLLAFVDDYRIPSQPVTDVRDLKAAPVRSKVFEVASVVRVR